MTKKIQLNFAILVLAFIILGSILAPLLATHNPFEPDMANRLQSPCWQHFFGTDALGRDMFSRILYGGRASMLLTLISSVLALILGVGVGLLCGFYGGKLDMFFTVLSNIFQGIPGSCFMIALAGILGPSIYSLVLALVVTSWAGFSRIVRAEVLQLMGEPFIEGLRCLGCSDLQIIVRHLLPNIANKLLVLVTIRLGRGILAIAGLSFLGFGDLYHPTWGTMINFAYKRGAFLRQAYGYLLSPGVCIMMLSLSFYLISLYFEHRQAAIQEK